MGKIKKMLPVGIQDFEKAITGGYLYVDKTDYIYNLAHGDGQAFFLSRPRRFGKSLFLSSLKAYWEGKKDLFNGLRITELEKDNPDAWQTYPVFYFDFNKDNYSSEDTLEKILNEHLKEWESEYDLKLSDGDSLSVRFQHLLEKVYSDTGKRSVILVDEYDKPLLENGETYERMENDKDIYKGFFSTLKSYDGYIRFSFLTGVTKFSKVSIFSDLNHLMDISMDERFACVCGITDAEIRACMDDRVEMFAQKNGTAKEACYSLLKRMYDGYRFHPNGEGVYNPFSLLNALAKNEAGQWWFETGTPTFLIDRIKSGNYDFKIITDGKLVASESRLKDYRDDNTDPVPLLYQTGYLTIGSYDKKYKRYHLKYPNDEVKYGFLESLLAESIEKEDERGTLDISLFGNDLERGDTDCLRDRLKALFASLPYTTDDAPVEQNFQNVIYLVFTLLGQFVKTEVHSALGRADVVVETDRYVYVMELKRDKSADEALAQIEEKGYALPYAADKRTVIKVGAGFSTAKRNLYDWKAIR